ncbi:hypothetical protein DFAR_3460016 [Desulfarculales bacterium]
MVTLSEAASDFFQVDSRVCWVGLGMLADSPEFLPALKNNAARLRVLRWTRKAFRPQVIISFGDATTVLAILAAVGRRVSVVACGHTNPHYHKRFVNRRPVLTIPNPIQPPHPDPGPPLRPWLLGPTVMSMGRLHPSNGFDLLLLVFATCQETGFQWQLVTLGEGPERPRLEALALELGSASRVTCRGWRPSWCRCSGRRNFA